MPESQLLIGLETSFKNCQKAQNVNMYSILKVYICFYALPLAYGLYDCENVDNYGWPLRYFVLWHLSYLQKFIKIISFLGYLSYLKYILKVEQRIYMH